jgi:hypothetical protein
MIYVDFLKKKFIFLDRYIPFKVYYEYEVFTENTKPKEIENEKIKIIHAHIT